MWWASGMACTTFGWTNKKNGSETERLRTALTTLDIIRTMKDVDYLDMLDTAYSAHDRYKNERAKIGTARHEELEIYVKQCIELNEGVPTTQAYIGTNPYVLEFKEWSYRNIKRFLWSELYCYSERLWVGGIADVGWVDMEDRIIAADFKSSKEAYWNQFIQIAGYDIQITENGGFNENGERTFEKFDSNIEGISGYCIIPFGAPTLTPTFKYNVDDYKRGFESALTLHKIKETV